MSLFLSKIPDRGFSIKSKSWILTKELKLYCDIWGKDNRARSDMRTLVEGLAL